MNPDRSPTVDAIRFDRDDEGIVTLTIDMPGQSANTMNPAFRAALEVAVERLVAERDRIKGVVLTFAIGLLCLIWCRMRPQCSNAPAR